MSFSHLSVDPTLHFRLVDEAERIFRAGAARLPGHEMLSAAALSFGGDSGAYYHGDAAAPDGLRSRGCAAATAAPLLQCEAVDCTTAFASRGRGLAPGTAETSAELRGPDWRPPKRSAYRGGGRLSGDRLRSSRLSGDCLRSSRLSGDRRRA